MKSRLALVTHNSIRAYSTTKALHDSETLLKRLCAAQPFFVVAGPCAIESEAMLSKVAESLSSISGQLQIPFVLKGSFDKANRTDGQSFRGLGLEDGLAVLHRVGQRYNLPTLTDVHDVHQVSAVARAVDVIQIPAFLCRQTDLITAAAVSGRIVNIKKGQFASAHHMLRAAQKALHPARSDLEGSDPADYSASSASKVLLTERGTFFGYGDLVVDARNLVRMRGREHLVLLDVCHSNQQPSEFHTNGLREMIPTIARMGAAVGVDGFYIEVHPSPSEAMSDRETQLPLDELLPLLSELKDIASATKGLPRKYD